MLHTPENILVQTTRRSELSDLDWLKVHPLLVQNLIKYEDHVQYREGWDDERIATEVGGTASASNVAYKRNKHWGKLPPKVPVISDPRITKLEEQVELLGSTLDDVLRSGLGPAHHALALKHLDLCDAFNRLIDQLKMAHVTDARAIKVNHKA